MSLPQILVLDAMGVIFAAGDDVNELLIARIGVGPRQILFVDDREKNLDAAAATGIQTRRFVPHPNGPVESLHVCIGRLSDVLPE